MSLGKKQDKRLTALIITASTLGILYFGVRAVRESLLRNTENPFAFTVEDFESIDPAWIRYEETQRILLAPGKAGAVAVDSEGRIFVSGADSIAVYTADGTLSLSFHTPETVRCLAVDPDGDIFCGLDDRVVVYDGTGVLRSSWSSPGEGAIFTSLALSEKYIFVADAGQKVVWRFDKTGGNPLRIGDADPSKDIPGFIIPSPYFDVAVDPDGFLWAANTGRHSLENYTTEGTFRTSWGEASMDIEGFCGCCNPSHFAVLENGFFVTSEKGIPRIKIYNRLGRLESVVAGPDLFKEGTVGLDLAVDPSQRIIVLDPAGNRIRIFEEKDNRQEKSR